MGANSTHKWAMLRGLVTSLVVHERIVTTVAKAKEMQRLSENMITTAKKTDKLHARRLINKFIYTKHAQAKLMHVLGPRYQFREGGYTRVMKLAKPKMKDKSDMAVIEYVDRPGEIRAARPPAAFQNLSLEEVMEKLGIKDEAVVLDGDDQVQEAVLVGKEDKP
eukprot:CAMPEP_0172439016 /NCGR_PEP_ID=MMETSP1065-20121228/134_1 /TAXON_ID=265537 /ORGANISM="Amphiprora paludosa, Strain CCMP125" /LENGTH=163 /DNA_ID=CAMNT_0013187637 /DNA_START=141 /DNA_END=632 /DNA_ORIENTATION=-